MSNLPQESAASSEYNYYPPPPPYNPVNPNDEAAPRGPSQLSLTEQLHSSDTSFDFDAFPWDQYANPASPATSMNELDVTTFGHRITADTSIPTTSPSVTAAPWNDVSRDHEAPRTRPESPPIDPPAVSDPAPRRRVGRPRTRPEPPPIAISLTFELLIHVLLPDKVTRTSNRKPKVVKQDPIKFGPTDVPTQIAWEPFLVMLAELVQTVVPNLAVVSFEWHFLKPNNSAWLPLNSSKALSSMLKQIATKLAGKKDSSSGYVVVRMQPPAKFKPQHPGPRPLMLPVSMKMSTLMVTISARCKKKARIDDELESLVDELREKYPPGLCKVHPDILCFHHRVLDLHFELERPRLLVWSAQIRAGKADKDHAPMGSNLFKAEHAIKKSKKPKAAPPIPAEPPNPAAAPPPPAPQVQGVNPYAALPAGYPGYPYMSPYMMPPMPNSYGGIPNWPFNHDAPAPAPRAGSSRKVLDDDVRSSSPPIPDCGVHDFCTEYKLGLEAERGLEKLEFQIGDDLDSLPEAEWQKAGFTHLGWKRVLAAYAKYKRHAKRR
ncbi:hypothetical protein B0H14DRAFT_3464204 [Mycena olivaceomarginata]|nr:hypothetical protein B0H14DRAFT_3464204 [Mycena olivaceomarginata]